MKKYLNLIIYIIGFILYSCLFIIIPLSQRLIFYFVALYFLYNIIEMVDKLISSTRRIKIKKYSQKLIIIKSKNYLAR